MRKFALPFFFCLALFARVDASAGDRILSVFTWENYFSPRAVALFEMEFTCQVEFYNYDSNDTMVQRLSEGGGYDIITPAGENSLQLYEQGMLLKLDHSLLPNLKNIAEQSTSRKHDKDMEFSVPYTVTVTGVAYNKTMVPQELVGSWKIFGDPRLAGKLTMLNDMRETLGAALCFLGLSVNTTNPTEIRDATRLLAKWKENLAMFSVDEAREGLRRGKFAAIQTYNGEFTLAANFNKDLDFYVPAEGTMLNSDQFVIGADTEHPDLAHAFIDFFLRPDIAAINMENIYYYMPNSPALEKVAERLKTNPAFTVPREVMEKCQVIEGVGDKRGLYDKAWEQVLFNEN